VNGKEVKKKGMTKMQRTRVKQVAKKLKKSLGEEE